MKKISIMALLLTMTILFASCATTFDGYYYDLDKCRVSEKKIYDDYDHLFTAKCENGMIDFVVDNDTLHVVEILTRKEKTQFNIKSHFSIPIAEYLNASINKNDYDWNESTKLDSIRFRWCIVEKSFNTTQDSLPAFEFMYNNTELHLCYEIYSE